MLSNVVNVHVLFLCRSILGQWEWKVGGFTQQPPTVVALLTHVQVYHCLHYSTSLLYCINSSWGMGSCIFHSFESRISVELGPKI